MYIYIYIKKNIIQLYDVYEDSTNVYLVLEL